MTDSEQEREDRLVMREKVDDWIKKLPSKMWIQFLCVISTSIESYENYIMVLWLGLSLDLLVSSNKTRQG